MLRDSRSVTAGGHRLPSISRHPTHVSELKRGSNAAVLAYGPIGRPRCREDRAPAASSSNRDSGRYGRNRSSLFFELRLRATQVLCATHQDPTNGQIPTLSDDHQHAGSPKPPLSPSTTISANARSQETAESRPGSGLARVASRIYRGNGAIA